MILIILNLMVELGRHPKYPHIVFKSTKSREDLLECLKAYAKVSMIDNEFIKQMNISEELFYE